MQTYPTDEDIHTAILKLIKKSPEEIARRQARAAADIAKLESGGNQ